MNRKRVPVSFLIMFLLLAVFGLSGFASIANDQGSLGEFHKPSLFPPGSVTCEADSKKVLSPSSEFQGEFLGKKKDSGAALAKGR